MDLGRQWTALATARKSISTLSTTQKDALHAAVRLGRASAPASCTKFPKACLRGPSPSSDKPGGRRASSSTTSGVSSNAVTAHGWSESASSSCHDISGLPGLARRPRTCMAGVCSPWAKAFHTTSSKGCGRPLPHVNSRRSALHAAAHSLDGGGVLVCRE